MQQKVVILIAMLLVALGVICFLKFAITSVNALLQKKLEKDKLYRSIIDLLTAIILFVIGCKIGENAGWLPQLF